MSYTCAKVGEQRWQAAQMFGKEYPSTKPPTSTKNQVRCQSRVSGTLVPVDRLAPHLSRSCSSDIQKDNPSPDPPSPAGAAVSAWLQKAEDRWR